MKLVDYCIKCRNPMAVIELSGKMKRCFVCVDEKCERFGLMTAVGYKLVKKINKEGGGKSAEFRSKGAKERDKREN